MISLATGRPRCDCDLGTTWWRRLCNRDKRYDWPYTPDEMESKRGIARMVAERHNRRCLCPVHSLDLAECWAEASGGGA